MKTTADYLPCPSCETTLTSARELEPSIIVCGNCGSINAAHNSRLYVASSQFVEWLMGESSQLGTIVADFQRSARMGEFVDSIGKINKHLGTSYTLPALCLPHVPHVDVVLGRRKMPTQ